MSALHRLEAFLRTTICSLALLHVYRKILIDADKVVDRFAVRHPRCLKPLDILNDDPPHSLEPKPF